MPVTEKEWLDARLNCKVGDTIRVFNHWREEVKGKQGKESGSGFSGHKTGYGEPDCDLDTAFPADVSDQEHSKNADTLFN